MKVLLYAEGKRLIAKSGMGKAIQHQAKALASAGIDYTFDPKDDFDIAHINTYGPGSFLLANRVLRQGRSVVYHAHSSVADIRNSFLFSNQLAPLIGRWMLRCYRLGDRIIAPTPYAGDLLRAGGIGNPISVVSNGIDVDWFQPDAAEGEAFRQRYGYGAEDRVVVAIGLYIERKGILDFVELARRMPDVKFVWFGSTPLFMVPAEIREAVTTELPNLRFPGYVDREEIRAALSGADLFLFPTWEETEGIVLLEALAMRQTVVIRDIPIYEGWLEDGVHLYKAADLETFERRIRGVLDGVLPRTGEQGHAVAAARSIGAVGRQLAAIYESVAKQPVVRHAVNS